MACFYFSESGLFNGLRPIQARKNPHRLRLCVFCLKRSCLFPPRGSAPESCE
jgi:hypothetical protein